MLDSTRTKVGWNRSHIEAMKGMMNGLVGWWLGREWVRRNATNNRWKLVTKQDRIATRKVSFLGEPSLARAEFQPDYWPRPSTATYGGDTCVIRFFKFIQANELATPMERKLFSKHRASGVFFTSYRLERNSKERTIFITFQCKHGLEWIIRIEPEDQRKIGRETTEK